MAFLPDIAVEKPFLLKTYAATRLLGQPWKEGRIRELFAFISHFMQIKKLGAAMLMYIVCYIWE